MSDRSKVCEECGVRFQQPPGRGSAQWTKRRFCSHSCSSKGTWRQRGREDWQRRFWRKVQVPGDSTDCWGWTGSANAQGYGRFTRGRVTLRAHRASWEIHHGAPPAGIFVLHHCDNPPCTNPRHLYLGSHQDNMDDRSRRGRNPRGSQHRNARITEQDVREIRAALDGGVMQCVLAKRFGVAKSTIWRVASGRLWSHVDAEETLGASS